MFYILFYFAYSAIESKMDRVMTHNSRLGRAVLDLQQEIENIQRVEMERRREEEEERRQQEGREGGFRCFRSGSLNPDIPAAST
jgi:hypothetical protein